MNKDKRQGFLAGMLTAALVLGLGGGALGAGKTIYVDDDISITINGVPFFPKSADGSDAPLFACNGVTYAPVRALANAAGLTVDYDAAARVARLETSDYAALTDPRSGEYVGVDAARQAALRDAGLSGKDVLFLKAALDWEDGKAFYDLKFCAGATEYSYAVEAISGGILSKELELRDYDWSAYDGWHSTHGAARGDDPSQLPNVIDEEAAKAAALQRLPNGSVTGCELEFDGGRWKYEVELRAGAAKYECKVDALTGAVLELELDD